MSELEESPSLSLSQVFHFVRRRRWWIMTTACGTSLATVFVLGLIPNRYMSEATVLVIQQQVPVQYVTPTTTTDISQALQGMTQEVLSRTRLLSVIEELGLYAKERQRLAPEEVIDRMRKDIDIQPLESNPERRTVNAFKISYSSDKPRRAQEVTSRLTTLFIEENVKTRTIQALVTTNFLQEQLDAASKKLTQQEERVGSFKMQHLGELPEQQGGNVQILAGLSAQLENTVAAMSRAQEQKVYLESLLRGYRGLAARGAALPNGPNGSLPVSPLAAAESQLRRLRAERAAMLDAYTPNHPDVKKKEQELARAEASVASLKSAAGETPTDGKPFAVAQGNGTEDDSSIAQVRSQLEANRLEIEHLTKVETDLKAQVTQYQSRLNAIPVREQQLTGMLRDYELLKHNYSDLLGKQQQSQLAMSMEKNQEGQQFRLVDPPSLPTVPTSPKRMKMSLGGAAGGILLGIALAFLIESRHRSFYTEEEIAGKFPMPIIIAMPLLLTPRETRERSWKNAAQYFVAVVLLLAVAAAEFYVYRHG
jgi:succinoglycan biosynthesis transport protein ExoP